jgi:hypothetical protein
MTIPQTRPTNNPFDLLNACGISAFSLYASRKKCSYVDGWADSPFDAAAARAHVASGGNVGIHMGTPNGGLVCIDVDANADDAPTPDAARARFHLPPDTLFSYRNDAPGRGKFFVRIDGELPPSTSWKLHRKAKKPDIDLLSVTRTGKQKQAFVIGTHPGGAVMQLSGCIVPALSRADFDAAWAALDELRPVEERQAADIAATLLAQPTPRAAQRPQATRQTTSGHTSPIDAAKAAWPSAYAIFEHFGYADDVEAAPGGWIRLKGNGGLMVRDPNGDNPHGWHAHSVDVGGGLLDAWGFCRTGQLPQHSDAVAIARDMLQAAGMEWPPRGPSTGTPTESAEPSELVDQPSAPASRPEYSPEQVKHALAAAYAAVDALKGSATGNLIRIAYGALSLIEEGGGLSAQMSEEALGAASGVSSTTAGRFLKGWTTGAGASRAGLTSWLLDRVEANEHDQLLYAHAYTLKKSFVTNSGWSKKEQAEAPAKGHPEFVTKDIYADFRRDEAFFHSMTPAHVRAAIQSEKDAFELVLLAECDDAERVTLMGFRDRLKGYRTLISDAIEAIGAEYDSQNAPGPLQRLHEQRQRDIDAVQALRAEKLLIEHVGAAHEAMQRRCTGLREQSRGQYLNAFGSSGLAVVQALASATAPLTMGELAEAANVHKNTLTTAVRRLSDEMEEKGCLPLVGVMCVGTSKRVALFSDWQNNLQAAGSHFNTYSVAWRRENRYVTDRDEELLAYEARLATLRTEVPEGVRAVAVEKRQKAVHVAIERNKARMEEVGKRRPATLRPMVVPVASHAPRLVTPEELPKRSPKAQTRPPVAGDLCRSTPAVFWSTR